MNNKELFDFAKTFAELMKKIEDAIEELRGKFPYSTITIVVWYSDIDLVSDEYSISDAISSYLEIIANDMEKDVRLEVVSFDELKNKPNDLICVLPYKKED